MTVLPPRCDDASHCITCGDEAVPLRVLKVDADRDLALCEDDGGRHTTVEIALVLPVAPGEQLLVHAGTAIARGAE
jgi:hydrogenase maturation factor